MADVASRDGKQRAAEPVSEVPESGSTALASLSKPVPQEGVVVAVAHGFFEVDGAESILRHPQMLMKGGGVLAANALTSLSFP